ncbi:hypothetical protein ACHHYP_05510 [Achlya hypogyna]|uniref:Polycystin cation channel PKD1/PKD2 domain-containing protein n=1 Tax=Achlya hypogyna TaxID=1202772 RepID=A0A1V9YXH2_ACHHY|nr:hypothetical protein ACHHYP_05510 [Achlya hypogyna]
MAATWLWIFRCSVHALLVVCLTLHADQVDNHLQEYTRGLADELWALLSGQDANRAHALELYTTDDSIAHVHQVVENYFLVPDVALGRFRVARCTTDDASDMGMPCPALRLQHSLTAPLQIQRYYELRRANESSWPVGLRYDSPVEASRAFFDALISMELSLRLESRPPRRALALSHPSPEYTNWNVSFAYDLTAQGQIHGAMVARRLLPSLTVAVAPSDFVVRYAVFIVLAIVYQVIHSSARSESSRSQVLELVHLCDTVPSRTNLVTILAHLYSVEPWFTVVSCMNVATVAVSCQAWQYAGHLAYFEQLTLTFASICGVAWLSSLRYLHANARFYILGLTLRRGLPRVVQFLLGVGPLFVGYVLFGTVVFGSQVPRFQGLTTTATTLFAIANGDEVRLTFDSLAATPVLGQVYLYSYIMLFTYVVLMVCIGIIEDAFFSSAFPTLWKQPKGDAGLSAETWARIRRLVEDETQLEAPHFAAVQAAILDRVRTRLPDDDAEAKSH